MAIIVTSAGKITVVPGETYIIDPGVAGNIEFVAGKYDPHPVDFNIVLDESPTHGHKIEIKIEGKQELSPNLTIADGYIGPETEIDFKYAADSDVSIGDNAVIKKFEVSEKGQDRVEVGAFDRDELIKLHQLELDGNGNGSAGDKLTLDISWLTPDELAKLEAALAYEGYVSDGAGGWAAGSSSADKVDVKFDLDGNGSSDFELKLHNWEHITLVEGKGPEEPSGPDFIVSGTTGADVIDVAYTGDPDGDMIDAGDNQTGGDEDVVDAGAGDDTVLAGEADDTVFAGSGDDSVLGHGGDDVIFGDQDLGTATGGATIRESLNWNLVDDPNGPNPIDNGDPIDGFTQNTGNVDVTFSVLTPNATVLNQFENTQQNIDDIDSGSEAINATSSFYSETRGQGNAESYQLSFSDAVENVSFRINDIDGDGIVRVTAFDASGAPVEIELTAGSNLTLLDTDAVPGVDTADSNGGYLADTAPEYSLLVEIAGPVSRIVIEHSQNGPNNSGVNVTDVFFDAPVVADPEGPGNDTLEGGIGDDVIYGETGDDSIVGGSGNDTLYGDDAPDLTPIGPNLIVNGSFEDTSGMTPTGYGFVGNGEIPGWTDAGGEAIDVHNDGRGGVNPTDGNNWLDLEATPGNNRVGQDVQGVQAGASYLLTFDAGDATFAPQSGAGENLINVYWGGELIATIDPNDGTMDSYEFVVEGGAGDGSDRLEFEGTGTEDNFGASVDNVSLVQVADPTGPAGNDTIEGGTGADVIFGQGGSDDLFGGDGDDTITGGAGDQIVGGSGSDSIVIDPAELDETGENDGPIFVDGSTEGSDQDTLDLTGFVAFRNLVETPDPDGDSTSGTLEVQNADGDWVPVTFAEIETLLLPPKAPDGVVDGEETGEEMFLGYDDSNAPTDGGGDQITNDSDVIEGNGGDDTIDAAGGDDTVDGGTGDDVIAGGSGDDQLDGGDGNDDINGGTGDDSLVGGDGDDTLAGGADNDTIDGGDGNDSVNGGFGDDLIVTGDEGSPDRATPPILGFPGIPGDADPFNDRDTVDAGAGNDTVITGDDNDVVFGGDGNDSIDTGFDDDSVQAGDGADTIIGGEGSDTLDGAQGDDLIFGGVGPGFDSLNVTDDGFNSPIGPDPILDNGDDLIRGGAGNDTIFGEDDNDTIFGDTGDDVIDGGIDDDSIEGGAGNDSVLGGHGDDFVRGNFGNDTLEGGRGSDTLLGDGDDDLITGGAGDSIVGGGGADTIVIDPAEVDGAGENATGIFVDGSTNGDDRDTLDLTAFEAHRNLVETVDPDGDSTSGSVEVLNTEGEWVPVTFAEIETLLLPPKAPDGVVDGEEFGEVMGLGYDDANAPTDGGGDLITNGDDVIEGNGGDDSIDAAGGNDTVDGGADNDTVNGNAGNDLLDGGDGEDLVTGGVGDDTVLGGTGDDELRGNDGDDSLDGGDGNDSMGGAEGADTLQGGAGLDTLSGGSGDDVLDGGLGDDVLNGNSGNDEITDLDGDNLVTSGPDGLPDRGFPFVGNADADPFNDRDTITTGDGNDTIISGDDNDVIDAGNGDNVIDAGFDDDSITSGDGNDLITSGEGSDTINSGGGDDTIFGGLGPVLGGSANLIDDNVNPANNDPILDNGDDLIDAGDGDDLVFGEDDNDTILGGAGDDTLDGGIDDDVIEGGAGDDVIIGGQGADSLSGGLGNDTFNVGLFTDPIFGDTYVEGAGDTIVGGEDPGDGDVDVLDLSGAGPLKIVFDDAVDPTGTPGESGTVTFFTDNTQTTVAGTLTFSEIENVIPCFTPGALIATPKGEVPVESLREGDKVITRDNGIQEIRWVGNRTLNRDELARAPNLRPVLIKAGSLGHGLPERDMLVSPQHRVLIAGDRTQLFFDESEVLVAAKHLVNAGSIQTVDTLRTTYIHFMFDRHEVVLSDGAWTESFQPGDQTLGAMGEETRNEIVALFPELATQEGITDYTAARRALKAHEAKLLQL